MQANKRGQNVALGGLVLQLLLAALAVGLWTQTRTAAALPVLWLVLGPLPLWLLRGGP